MKNLTSTLSLTLIICSTPVLAGGFGSAGMVKAMPITFTITNNTDQELTLVGRYEIKPSTNKGLLDMPNPFEYKKIPAHTSNITRTFDVTKRGGRLGSLLEVTLITPEKHIIKSFEKGTSWTRQNSIVVEPKDLESMSTESLPTEE